MPSGSTQVFEDESWIEGDGDTCWSHESAKSYNVNTLDLLICGRTFDRAQRYIPVSKPVDETIHQFTLLPILHVNTFKTDATNKMAEERR